MPKAEQQGITVKKAADTAEWYSQLVIKSELADYSAVRGCLVIRPYGYAIWQAIMDYLNARLKLLNVQNAYFPLLIPEHFFQKEAKHAEGFRLEVAWVESKDDKAKYAIRPTSETVIYDAYARWVRSWRDLPLRLNQWVNILRWEVKDVKPFIRSREFLWQEGHCIYEDEAGCDADALIYLNEYRKLCEELLAVPVLLGMKTEKEKFAGALRTYTMEAFMPDGKALQMGTSHNLGQGFAKAFGIKYVGKDEKEHVPWQNSWGVSTRLIGGMAMLHGDDKGLVLPPKIAPIQLVIIPIIFEESKQLVLKAAQSLAKELAEFRIHADLRDEYSAGWKFNAWELKGVPLRVEIGPKDIAQQQVVLVRRDTGKREQVKRGELKKRVQAALEEIQQEMLMQARKRLQANIAKAAAWQEFLKIIKGNKIALAPFCGREECEGRIKDETGGVSSRAIPFEQPKKIGKCVKCGSDGKFMVWFSNNY
ncbi:proline--tRNA ligase [Candidatus Woesearchaeota archaeon]|nr:proline--tRNA ligase [Candidatus Woesearchaeota archaeon]